MDPQWAPIVADEKAAGEYEFKLPDFDEDTFIHREMVSFKTTTILFIWGIIAAALSWIAFAALKGEPRMSWLVGLGICLATGLMLKPIFARLKTDIKHWKRREWLGTGFLFFFTWLSFFMVAINPPFSDFAPPQALATADPPVQVEGGMVRLSFLAVDNGHVASRQLAVQREGGEAQVQQPANRSGDLETYDLAALAPGKYVVTVTATDGRGLRTVSYANFTVRASDFEVVLPPNGQLGTTSLVAARLPGHKSCNENYAAGCVRTVYAKLADGKTTIAFDAPAPDSPGVWTAKSSFAGWSRGNNTFSMHAEFLNHYLGAHSIPGGKIDLAGPYVVNVTVEPGTHQAEVRPPQAGRMLNVPHIEAVAVIVVVLVGAVIARRKSDA